MSQTSNFQGLKLGLLLGLFPATLQFVSSVYAQGTGGELSKIGSWEIIGESDVVCIHTALLPDSRLLCVERPHVVPYPTNPHTNGQIAVEIDLKNNTRTIVPLNTNAFCGGHAHMADGNIYFTGGEDQVMLNTSLITSDGRKGRRVYDAMGGVRGVAPGSRWTIDTDMTTARWYPSVTTMADGRMIVVGGSTKQLDLNKREENISNPTYEYYPPKEGTWPQRLEVLAWATPYDLYPAVYQLPTGPLLMFVSNRTVILNPADESIDESIPPVLLDDKRPWIYPYTPTSVILPLTQANNYTAEIMMCGGSHVSTEKADDRCIHLNMGESKPQWKDLGERMKVGRVMPMVNLMPDGTVMFLGGAKYGEAGGNAGWANMAWEPSHEVDIYDPRKPAGQRWTSVAANTIPRLYHSGTVLLPDGRVVTTGSEMQNYIDLQNKRFDCYHLDNQTAPPCTSPFEYRIEAFNPPYWYLPKDHQPIIKSAPQSLTYKSHFIVTTTTNAQSIDFVSFIRYSTSTHSINFDQRLVELKILGYNSSALLVEAPDNGALAPPGNWMLFLVSRGKPSVAATVLLGEGQRVVEALPVGSITPEERRKKEGSGAGRVGTGVVGLVVGALVAFATMF